MTQEPATVEMLLYRDRSGRLRVRARWTRFEDSKPMEIDEGGVYDGVDDFAVGTLIPLLRRTFHGD